MNTLKIKSIKEIDYTGDVYDLSFDKDHYFFAKSAGNNYIKIHNCMADIDWDSEQSARGKILEYLISKYGPECVSNVATFGTYKPKSALQAMSRGLKKDTGHDTILMKKITKLEGLEDTDNLIGFFETVKRKTNDNEILDWINNNQDTIEFSQRILGQITQLGTHAGGIVVTPGPIWDFIPVTKGGGNLITAFKEADGSGKDLSELGILKLDVLGLVSLNILKDCVLSIKENTGIDLEEKINYLPLDDKKMLDFFGTGNNYGVFQMEKSKMFTDKMRVDSFHDIIAINAMNRPGPLEKYLDKYGYWKAIDKNEIDMSSEELEKVNKQRYPFAFMEATLKETYGCLLYQEQFMKMIADMTGMTFGEADSFRRAIAWTPDNPKYYTVKSYFDNLEKSMIDKGYTKTDVDNFVQYCRDFMGYSFNKSHATAYTYITWQTLYFKVYYPAYFYAAMINNAGNIEEIQEIISDARTNEIEILQPSIAYSKYKTVAQDNNIVRLGFGVIKGMGASVENSLKDLGKSLHEILKNISVNKTQFQNLIDIGAFDDFGIDREEIFFLKEIFQDENIEKWFTRKKQTLRKETIPKSLSKFDSDELIVLAIKSKNENEGTPWINFTEKIIQNLSFKDLNIDDYKKITLDKQIELMGFTLVKNDLLKFESTFKAKGYLPFKEFSDEEKTYYFSLDKVEVASTKTGKKYLNLMINGKKIKCWKDISLEIGKLYYGQFSDSKFGLTLDGNSVYSV